MSVFNNIVSIYPGIFRAGRDADSTSGTYSFNYSIFYGDAVNGTGELADATGIAFSSVNHIASVFVTVYGFVGTGFHASTTGYAAECFAINKANCPCRTFLDAFTNALAFVGC